jgi:tetratricopeptide (TPR) repeat protein
VRILVVWTALLCGVADLVGAQLAVSQPQEQILLLPLAVGRAEDSAASVKTMDLARERLTAIARYRIVVVPKAKLCEALQASGFGCDGLLDDQQARQLARFLRVSAYTTGRLERADAALAARLRVVDISSSGLAGSFAVAGATLTTPETLAEAVAQRINVLVRAAENARECTTLRQRGNLPRAVQAAQKAIAADPGAVSAHLCLILVYEAQRQPADSVLAVANRVLAIDSLNATAWDTRRGVAQQKNDTTMWIGALQRLIAIEPYNVGRILGTAQLLYQMQRYPDAVANLDRGLATNPGDQAMIELRTRACIDGAMWRCALDGLTMAAEQDTMLPHDTAWVRVAIGAAQQIPDTQAYVHWTGVAVRHFPGDYTFWKTHGSALDLAGKPDSGIVAYTRALAINPNDIATGLLVAKSIVDNAVWDTTGVRGDTARLAALRTRYADRLDSARVYTDRALAAPDTTYRISAAVIMLTAGSKLAQAGAYGRAYPWLDRTLTLVERDTEGPRRQIRVNASFWWGLSSFQTLSAAWTPMAASKNCAQARAFNDRLARTKEALTFGARVHVGTANNLLQGLARYEEQMPKVKAAFKCTNF